MIESWLLELAKGIGKGLLNPLLYWGIILVIVAGYFRIQKERKQFRVKIFDYFAEWKGTWMISLSAGLLISLFTLGIGTVFTYEVMLLLSIVTIILSFTFTFSMLSASYTIGITYLLLLLSPLLLKYQTVIEPDFFSPINFTSLTILLGIFLIVEAALLTRTNRNQTFPDLVLSQRGRWIGRHRIKKLSIIPFFVIVPTGSIEPFAYWPFFEIGGETYSLLLVPFLIGFNYLIRSMLPEVAVKQLRNSLLLLAIIVLAFAVGSIYLSWLTIVAVIVAILGREYINFKHSIKDREDVPYFYLMEDGLIVLGVIPGTPADRLGILVGEKVTKVNGTKIKRAEEFYYLLQTSGAYFKLEVIDIRGEMRFVESAFYENDHHQLGLVFIEEPYQLNDN